MKTFATLALLTIALTMLTACGGDDGSSNSSAPTSADWKLASAPADATDIKSAMTSAKDGESITLTGRVGGRMEPISTESGLLVVVDKSIKSCKELHGDGCPTPWDYCCEPKDNLVAGSATVQLADASEAAALGSIKPLDVVTVVGTVSRPTEKSLIVKATGIYVHPAE